MKRNLASRERELNNVADEDDQQPSPTDLRKLLDAAHRERDEAKAKLAEREQADRARSVESILTAKNGKSSWAKYVKIDGEVNEATVQAWLESTGKEDFGWSSQAAPPAPPAATPQGQQASTDAAVAARISQTVSTSSDAAPEGAMTPDRIHNMSDADLQRLGWGADNGGRRPHRRPPPQQYR